MNADKENKTYDFFRGCTVEVAKDGTIENHYRQGCCKLEVYNTYKGIHLSDYSDLFEVRFKNTRKGIYVNESGQGLKVGDFVIVEAATGYDLGIITLEGPAVKDQIKAKAPYLRKAMETKKILRKARPMDIARWQEAIARENETMIRARQLAANLGLDMKIGDVEFQGDGTKAIFYYIADQRVDFRQLIKDFAEEFHIRIEMKQIGSRQEAGLIGGLGICGRELCCSNYITSFQSISTVAAKIQDLSLNPVKLAGQCGKLKCCLNYEASQYYEAQQSLPKVNAPLEFDDGFAYLMKTDILGRKMFFSFDKGSLANLVMLTPEEVAAVQELNAQGKKARFERPGDEAKEVAPEFVSAEGEGDITRFDKKRSGGKKRHGHGGHGGNQGGQGNGQNSNKRNNHGNHGKQRQTKEV